MMAACKLVLEGRVSINSFVFGLSVIIVPLIRVCFGHLDWVFDYLTETPGKIAICVHIAVVNGLLLIIYRGPLYKVSVDVQLSAASSWDLIHIQCPRVFTTRSCCGVSRNLLRHFRLWNDI